MDKLVNIKANLRIKEASLTDNAQGNIIARLDFDGENNSASAFFDIRLFKQQDGTTGVTCTPVID